MKNFQELSDRIKTLDAPRNVAVVWAEDDHTREACALALAEGFVTMTFIGRKEFVANDEHLAPFADKLKHIEADNALDAANIAAQMAYDGQIDVIMKGLVSSDDLLRAILNKEHRLVPQGGTLTHVAALFSTALNRIVLATDCAVIPTPKPEQRLDQVRFITDMARSMGIGEPRVALVSCIEKINERHLPFSATYPDVISRAEEGQFGACKVFGPLDLKTSVDVEAAKAKHIDNDVAGHADCLVFPDIVSANVFYKTLTLYPGTESAALLVGACVPVVMPSRADSAQCKLRSLMLAALQVKG